MGTFLYKIVNVHLTFIQLFSSAFFNVDVEFFFFLMAAWHFLVGCLFLYICILF